MTWEKLVGPAPLGAYVRPLNEGRERGSRYAEPTPIAHLAGSCFLTEAGPVPCWPWQVWRGEGPPTDLDEVRVGRPRRVPANNEDFGTTGQGQIRYFTQFGCCYHLDGEWWVCMVTDADHHP